MWTITLIIFILVNLFLMLKLIYYKDFRWEMLVDLKFNLFFAPYSMGFSTVINMITLLTIHYTNDNFKLGLVIFWFVNVIFAMFASWIILVFIIKNTELTLADMNPQIILLALPLSVVASCGSLVTTTLDSNWRNVRRMMMVLNFLLLSSATFLAFIFFDIMFLRMLIHKYPPRPLQFSIFPTLGYLGHATWGMQLNFLNLRSYLEEFTENSPAVTDTLKLLTLLFCLYMFSIGFLLTFIGICINWHYGMPKFSKLYWIVPFPLIAFALGLNEFFKVHGMQTFKVIGMIYGAVGIIFVVGSFFGSIIYEFPWSGLKAYLQGRSKDSKHS
ncbi:unnamed protein product [Ambrosiozyma monospora]|uniref:Unnamed protein product n=1 Tax=Ambrosiozyma monospora TaxID=43982 RepID=A0ACB5T061_AMBMO|nr:unnamed protein product [Ambrosiozyma monospora]